MSAALLLNWALVAISLFNTILLLWLALALWLNADRRNFGILITALGFALGGLFFISQAALLLSDEWTLSRSNTLWVALGMTPVVMLPLVWYAVLLWYAGFWLPVTVDGRANAQSLRAALRRRHRPWLIVAGSVALLGLICLALLGIPYLPFVDRLYGLLFHAREFIKRPVFGIPLVALGYPPYVVLCVGLAVDVLRQPGISDRTLGDLARARARPWLTAATLLSLLIGVLVAGVVVWTVTNTREAGYYILREDDQTILSRAALTISLLIGFVTVLLGQGMTAYELFTGKAIPRRELARHWKRAIILAAGYGILLGGALVWGLDPTYAVLLTALLMTGFFALVGWRSQMDWNQAMRQLRPFVASARWYDSLTSAPDERGYITEPFAALCENVLGVSVAYLLPTGTLAAFVLPQSYPPGRPAPAFVWLADRDPAAAALALSIPPDQHGGAAWALPLWSERGLIGALLLGPRRDGGLYAQEQLEIARAAGERLIDTAASLTLSQRLMQLQRERMAATQILDQRTRRVLHDEVLPLIHTAMLALSSDQPRETTLQRLSEAHAQVSNLLRDLPMLSAPDVSRLGLLAALYKAATTEFGSAFESLSWQSDAETEKCASRLAPLRAETLFFAARELMRNAAKHARPIETGARPRLRVAATCAGGQFNLSIEDNGRGTGDMAAPWEQASSLGHGLELHSTMMAIAGGALTLERTEGGTRAALTMPVGPEVERPPEANS